MGHLGLEHPLPKWGSSVHLIVEGDRYYIHCSLNSLGLGKTEE